MFLIEMSFSVVFFHDAVSIADCMAVAEEFNETDCKGSERKRSFSNGGNCYNPGTSLCLE
jgi:hypothetical protein